MNINEGRVNSTPLPWSRFACSSFNRKEEK